MGLRPRSLLTAPPILPQMAAKFVLGSGASSDIFSGMATAENGALPPLMIPATAVIINSPTRSKPL